jgi:4-hydroxythreonine-4-phosphate dehydrogenase
MDGVVSEAIRPADAAATDGARRRLEVLAVSDDLTGAAALAGEFHAGGLTACVAGAGHAVGAGARADALVVDTRSRHLSAADAAGEVVRALLRDGDEPRSYFKRIDSALRGNVAAELDAVAGHLGRALVLAAAAPALEVVTRGGLQRSGASPGTRLRDLVPGDAVEVPLEQVRGPGLDRLLADAVASGRHVVCDGETDADLALVASALIPLAGRAVPVGSYGLGRAWAAVAPGSRDDRPGVLVAVSSLKRASRRQVEVARERGALTIFEAGDNPLDAAAELERGRDVVLLACPEVEDEGLREDPAVADRLARRVVEIAASRASRGVVLVGGELSSAFFGWAGAHSARVVVEPWPAAPVLRLHGGILDGQTVLTKSGAQGDDDWLDRAVTLMRGLAAARRGATDA